MCISLSQLQFHLPGSSDNVQVVVSEDLAETCWCQIGAHLPVFCWVEALCVHPVPIEEA